MQMRSLFYEDSLRIAIRYTLSLILDLMADERVIRIKQPMGSYSFQAVNFGALLSNREIEDIEFDIDIQAGTRAMSARLRSELALLLHREPTNQGNTLLPDDVLLDMLDVPNKDEVLRKLDDLREEQRIMAMVSNGVPVPPVMLAMLALKKRGLPEEYMDDIAQVLEEAGADVGQQMGTPTQSQPGQAGEQSGRQQQPAEQPERTQQPEPSSAPTGIEGEEEQE